MSTFQVDHCDRPDCVAWHTSVDPVCRPRDTTTPTRPQAEPDWPTWGHGVTRQQADDDERDTNGHMADARAAQVYGGKCVA